MPGWKIGLNVVRLAEVIPGHNLDGVWLEMEGLLPPIEPYTVSSPDPSFVVSRQISLEPGRYAHHDILFGRSERSEPFLISRCGHVMRSVRPHIPAEGAVVEIHLVARSL